MSIEGHKTLQTISVEHLADQRWGLIHKAMTNTRAHHDTLGKVAQIEGQVGLKVWFVMYPASSQIPFTSLDDVRAFQTSFMTNEEGCTYPNEIDVYAFLISPGAVL